jgi:superfamily I DNA/RNA helicase
MLPWQPKQSVHFFVATPNDRVLFTTFTRNLAADIRENLKKICSEEAMKRIEVVNLDRWTSEFLRKNGYEHKVVYGHMTTELWEKALTMAPSGIDLNAAFYREEWDRVIQPQSVETLEQYMKASRIGRGLRLNRKARKEVWPVFEEYRVLLNDSGLRESVDAMRDARRLLEQKGSVLPYNAVVVDEAQDLGMQAFKLIRSLLPKDQAKPCLFIVGDAHQRIYRQKVVLGRCGIDIRGRGRKLLINYRTTDETRRWAVRLLEGLSIDDLDGGLDDHKGYRALLHGAEPTVENFASFKDEVAAIAKYLQDIAKTDNSLSSVCLVTRTNELLDQFESALNANDIQTCRVKRSQAEDRAAEGVRLATMHRVKGLEYERVIIAGASDSVVPLEIATSDSSDPVVQHEGQVHERALFYVAATRARQHVLVTSSGRPSPFLC